MAAAQDVSDYIERKQAEEEEAQSYVNPTAEMQKEEEVTKTASEDKYSILAKKYQNKNSSVISKAPIMVEEVSVIAKVNKVTRTSVIVRHTGRFQIQRYPENLFHRALVGKLARQDVQEQIPIQYYHVEKDQHFFDRFHPNHLTFCHHYFNCQIFESIYHEQLGIPRGSYFSAQPNRPIILNKNNPEFQNLDIIQRKMLFKVYDEITQIFKFFNKKKLVHPHSCKYYIANEYFCYQ